MEGTSRTSKNFKSKKEKEPSRRSISRAQKARQAELEKEIEQEIEEALQAPTDSDEEVQTRQLAMTRRSVKQKAPVKEGNKSKPPTRAQLLDHLKNRVVWKPTRFPDPTFLREAGMYDEVFLLLKNMKFESLLTMEPPPMYKDASCHFLSSLEVTYHRGQQPESGRGTIHFKVKGKSYSLTFKEIEEIMGWNDDRYDYLPVSYGVQNKVWHLITCNRAHNPQKNRNANMRNPVIRYVHRTLGNTIFARRESGNVLDEELILIGMGLETLIGTDELYTNLQDDIFEDFGRVGFFVKRLIYYKGWAWTTPDKTPQLHIGGLITPLLRAVGVPLHNEKDGPKGPELMDGTYMQKVKYLTGMFEERFVYSFEQDSGKAEILLPNPALSTVNTVTSLHFNIPQEMLLGPHGPLNPVRRHRQPARSSSSRPSHTASASHPVPETQEETQGPDSPSRFYFQPHTGALPKGPLRDAHEYIGKLEGWNRVQDKSYKKLKGKYKSLKKTVKKMKEFLIRAGIGGCTAEDFTVDTSAPQPQPQPQPQPHHGASTSREMVLWNPDNQPDREEEEEEGTEQTDDDATTSDSS